MTPKLMLVASLATSLLAQGVETTARADSSATVARVTVRSSMDRYIPSAEEMRSGFVDRNTGARIN